MTRIADQHQIDALDFDAHELAVQHPPRIRDRNKRIIHDIVCPPGFAHSGRVAYSRWRAHPLPDDIGAARTNLVNAEGWYDYAPTSAGDRAKHWHVNFADANLFFGYGSSLFAQDEIQVAEHPALGSVREALVARGLAALTIEGDAPTPVLVTGVERRGRVDTSAGLYGSSFASASEASILRAVAPIDPPTISNIIAMAAPSGGRGAYTSDQLRAIATTAYSAFRAASSSSERDERAVIRTGYWGCGAFGGRGRRVS